jgi:hypothetical protein
MFHTAMPHASEGNSAMTEVQAIAEFVDRHAIAGLKRQSAPAAEDSRA